MAYGREFVRKVPSFPCSCYTPLAIRSYLQRGRFTLFEALARIPVRRVGCDA